MKYLMLVALLALTSCKTFDTSTKKIEAACASATSSIQVAALYKDKLSSSQLTTVRRAIQITQPVCGDRDTIPTLDSVKQAALENAVAQLFQIATEVQK